MTQDASAARTRAVEAQAGVVALTVPVPGLAESLIRAGYEVVSVDPADGGSLPELLVCAAPDPDDRRLPAIRELRARRADAVIVCLLGPDDTGVSAALAAGADVVLETGDLELIPVAVEVALKGYVMHPQPSRRRLDEAGRPLSSRERQTLALVTLGLSNGEIARKLNITESTVKSHLASSFAKLGVHSRAEATARILTESDVAAGILAMPGSREQLSILRRDGNA